MTEIEEFLEENGLIYFSDSAPGITRLRIESTFVYYSKSGKEISDEKILTRIKKLGIPPAWENVWIAPHPNAHL